VTERAGRWAIERKRGSAQILHDLPVPTTAEPAVWIAELTDACVVLGSAQSDELVDRDRLDELGLGLARRRSGGGAVLVQPGHLLWVDVLVPAGDAVWHADVGRAFHWLGEVWEATVETLGGSGWIHRGPYERSAIGDLVCFAGRGPGEVFVGDSKVVGLSQRRTRDAARFQCALVLEWAPEPLLEVFHRVDLEGFAATVRSAGTAMACDAAAAEAAFLAQIARV
jgi:lipoate---protein ligase